MASLTLSAPAEEDWGRVKPSGRARFEDENGVAELGLDEDGLARRHVHRFELLAQELERPGRKSADDREPTQNRDVSRRALGAYAVESRIRAPFSSVIGQRLVDPVLVQAAVRLGVTRRGRRALGTTRIARVVFPFCSGDEGPAGPS